MTPGPPASSARYMTSGKDVGTVFHAFSLEKVPGILWDFLLVGENLRECQGQGIQRWKARREPQFWGGYGS